MPDGRRDWTGGSGNGAGSMPSSALPRCRRRRGPLTAREREVAGLVTRGYSNRQIAEELMLSVRTVTTHVSHIFAKLGIASRGGLAAALERTEQTS